MSIGIFTDKNHQPSDTEICGMIGTMVSNWNSLIHFIRKNYKVKDELKYMYGQKYGWALRFQINSKLFTALYPTENGFSVQIILKPEALDQAIPMKLSKNILSAISNAYPYPEGRWLFITTESEKDIEGIKQLLAMKSEKLIYKRKQL